MTADRIDYYANLLRGIPVAELGRKIKEILRDATNEERDAERKRIANKLLDVSEDLLLPECFK